ncbi:MAG TPA: hypothetical protein VNT76_07985, partial [Candidatus Binatus sp.]|nr:hypothetical protein [Candidatus Binatus sp.]
MAKKALSKKRAQPKKISRPSKPAASRPKPSPGASAAPRVAAAAENEIKRLDREILKLINRRGAATIKSLENIPNPHKALFAPFADDQLSELIEKLNPGPLPSHAVRGVFREI